MSVPNASREQVEVVGDAERLGAILSPLRRRVLAALDEPDSASGVARRLGLPRQKVNYHLRELERGGWLELVDTRRRRGCTERLVRAKARGWLIDPTLLAELGGEPDEVRDRFSSAWLLRTAAELLTRVAALRREARDAGKRLATMTLETEVAFARPSEFRAYVDELADAVAEISSRYQSDDAQARRFRFVVAGHPRAKD